MTDESRELQDALAAKTQYVLGKNLWPEQTAEDFDPITRQIWGVAEVVYADAHATLVRAHDADKKQLRHWRHVAWDERRARRKLRRYTLKLESAHEADKKRIEELGKDLEEECIHSGRLREQNTLMFHELNKRKERIAELEDEIPQRDARIAELERELEAWRRGAVFAVLDKADCIETPSPLCEQTTGPGHVYQRRCIYCGRPATDNPTLRTLDEALNTGDGGYRP